jgi:CHAT domain-containing protein/tetratricopeptide (TPR) repeat protein
MCLHALKLFLLAILIAIASVLPPTLAQSLSDADLNSLKKKGFELFWARKYTEALSLAERYAQVVEARYGPENLQYATALYYIAEVLKASHRFAEAERFCSRALAIDEKISGPYNPKVARDLITAASLLHATSRFSEAEPLIHRALDIDKGSIGTDDPELANDFNSLALLLQATNRVDEAEQLLRRALALDERHLGEEHPQFARDLNDLAALFVDTYRFDEAEPLYRRALAINEKTFGSESTAVAVNLSNLAVAVQMTKGFSEAELLLRRSLDIDEKVLGPTHPDIAIRLNNLANLLVIPSRFDEAEALLRRALQINQTNSGPNHLSVAKNLGNLATLLQKMGRLTEAEVLMHRALAIKEESLGADHPMVADDLGNLANLNEDQGHWAEAVRLFIRAKPIMTASHRSWGTSRGDVGKSVLAHYSGLFRDYARALFRSDASAAGNLAAGFELAQWALQNEAAFALTSMAVRFGKGEQRLAKLVREQQDLFADREAAYRRLDEAVIRADTMASGATRAALADIEAKLSEKLERLRKEFPDYAELADPKPLPIKQAQALLGESQALVLFLDLWQMGRIPEETIVFALTKKEARWVGIYPGTNLLQRRVASLRCGLDEANWRFGEQSWEACKMLLGIEASENELPPFDAAAAHALYRDLFGGIEDLIKDKSLLIVPSGALTQLPFEALVTEKPDESLPRFEAYRTASWLGQRQAITMLPSVGSLRALRIAKASSAPAPFVGFGNPLLIGRNGDDRTAWEKQDCGKATSARHTRIASLFGGIASLFRAGVVDVEELRREPPLPETADELCAVASALGVPASELNKAVHLGSHATVSEIKALSQSGELARARVVHFATHGLIAGQTAMFAKTKAEPALLLTPPASDKVSEEDNGLLTASEVAQLNLNADWVVMSACNTAAGSTDGAEALSGLARAFFYAGARSLLVSHWEVDSDAAVAITTGAVNAMKAAPKIGRAEALRRSIGALIAKGGIYTHPSVWAPFVLVGNGEQRVADAIFPVPTHTDE